MDTLSMSRLSSFLFGILPQSDIHPYLLFPAVEASFRVFSMAIRQPG
jgi:hypothetical protein